MRVILWIVFIIVFVSAFINRNYIKASANEAELKISVDTNSALIAEPINITYELFYSNDYEFIQFSVGDSIPSQIEFLDSTYSNPQKRDNKNYIKYNFEITSFDSGYYELLPASAIFKNNAEQLDTIYGSPIYLHFATVEIDTNLTIKGIKPPMGVPLTFWEVFPYFIGGLLLLGIIIGIILYLSKKKKTPKPEIKFDPKIPPHVAALAALDELNKEQLWQKEQFKLYYIKLTEIIRLYIERRYNIRALEMISDEIIESMYNLELHAEFILKMKKLFGTADLAKFAKFHPNVEENINNFNIAVEFVETTIPIEKKVVTNDKQVENE